MGLRPLLGVAGGGRADEPSARDGGQNRRGETEALEGTGWLCGVLGARKVAQWDEKKEDERHKRDRRVGRETRMKMRKRKRW